MGLSREFNKFLSYQVFDRIQRTLIYEESTSSLSEVLISALYQSISILVCKFRFNKSLVFNILHAPAMLHLRYNFLCTQNMSHPDKLLRHINLTLKNTQNLFSPFFDWQMTCISIGKSIFAYVLGILTNNKHLNLRF